MPVSNEFVITAVTDGVTVSGIPSTAISKQRASDLAAWLVSYGDPSAGIRAYKSALAYDGVTREPAVANRFGVRGNAEAQIDTPPADGFMTNANAVAFAVWLNFFAETPTGGGDGQAIRDRPVSREKIEEICTDAGISAQRNAR